MRFGKVLFLTRNFLKKFSKDKSLNELNIYDFKIDRQSINECGFIMFIDDNNKSKVLKSRYRK